MVGGKCTVPEGNPRASAGCWRTSHLGYTSSEKQSIVITDVGKPNARGISVKLVFRSCKTLPYKLSLVKYVPQMRFDSSCSHIQCCDLIQPDEYISPRFSGIRKHSIYFRSWTKFESNICVHIFIHLNSANFIHFYIQANTGHFVQIYSQANSETFAHVYI